MTGAELLAWASVAGLLALVAADRLAAHGGGDLRREVAEALTLRRSRRSSPAAGAGAGEAAGPAGSPEARAAEVAETAAPAHPLPARFLDALSGPRLLVDTGDGDRLTVRLYHPCGLDHAGVDPLLLTSLRWRPSTGWEARVSSLRGSWVAWGWSARHDPLPVG